MRHAKLSRERREALLSALQALHLDEFGDELSRFRAEAILDLCERHIAPPVYNRAIADAQAALADKLGDLADELYEDEEPLG